MTQANYRVLVVDDDPTIRGLTARALTGAGLRCQLAVDGRDGLAHALTGRFDAIVTDIRMPAMNGHALAVELLSREDRPLIVVLTGVLEPRIAQDLLARGVDDVSFKPVDYKAFAAKVVALLHMRDRRRRAAEPIAPSEADPPAPALEREQGTESQSEVFPAEAASPMPAVPADSPSATKHIVALRLRDPARGRELSDLLGSASVEAVATASSEGLHTLLNAQRVDLIVIEQELDGFLTGLEILDRLFKDLLRPETILLAERTSQISEPAAQLGIGTILSPKLPLPALADAVRGVIAARGLSTALIPHHARRLVQECGSIPPMPQLLVKLLSYMDLNAQDVPLKDLADDISVDPAATAALLTLTNSSSIGFRQKITRVFDAVNLLGARRTVSLIVSSAALASQTELLREWSEPLRNWYRQRSVLIASTAATFARALEHVAPDTAFVLGLLQDVGILILGNSFAEKYQAVTLRRAREIGQLRLHSIEQDDYKLTHAEVSAALLQRWKLPQSLIRLVLDHHKPDAAAERSRTDRSFLRVMQIGEALADLSEVPHPVRRQALNRLLTEYTDDGQDRNCRDCIAASVARTVESCRLFSLPLPDETTLHRIAQQVAAFQSSSLPETAATEPQPA